jgi:hypothetical protein
MTLGPSPDRKLKLVKPGVLRHWCPGCGCTHDIDIHATSRNGRVNGWDGDVARPTIAEPLQQRSPRGTCEYVLRAGVLYFMNNCWHPLSGKTRHLEEIPQ